MVPVLPVRATKDSAGNGKVERQAPFTRVSFGSGALPHDRFLGVGNAGEFFSIADGELKGVCAVKQGRVKALDRFREIGVDGFNRLVRFAHSQSHFFN
jgi:hypothetical protein